MKTYWTEADFHAGLCSFEDIATPRPPPELPPLEVPDLPPELASIPAAILKRDAMIAYRQLGGPAYLMANEQLLAKVLVRLLPAEVMAQTKSDITITINWASPDRLSYQRGEVIEAEPVAEPAEAIETKPVAEPPAVPWKEPKEDTEMVVAVHKLLDDAKNSGPKNPPVSEPVAAPMQAEQTEGKGTVATSPADAPTLPPWIIELPDSPGLPKPEFVNGQVWYFGDDEEGRAIRRREKALEKEALEKETKQTKAKP